MRTGDLFRAWARRVGAAALLATLALAGGVAAAEDTVRLAVTAGPHAQIAEVAKKVAERDGLVIKIVEFQDYIQPNAVLDADIAENPKGLQIVQVEAAQLPRSLDDLAASAINTNYAVQAGLVPTRDAIAIEDARNP